MQLHLASIGHWSVEYRAGLEPKPWRDANRGSGYRGYLLYPLPGYGILSFQNDLTLTLKYQQQNIPDGPFIGYLGTIGV